MANSPNECSKCSAELDTAGFPKWCKACRAKYKREYEGLKKEMAETRGYSAGISAMREFLAVQFVGYTIQRFSGPEIAHIIRNCSAPVD